MKRENEKQAIEQAKALIAQGEALLAMPDDYDWEKVLGSDTCVPKYTDYVKTGADCAALKRRSMDLTRALSNMRQDK